MVDNRTCRKEICMFHESLNEATGGCEKGSHAGQNYLSRNERGCGKLSYHNLFIISQCPAPAAVAVYEADNIDGNALTGDSNAASVDGNTLVGTGTVLAGTGTLTAGALTAHGGAPTPSRGTPTLARGESTASAFPYPVTPFSTMLSAL